MNNKTRILAACALLGVISLWGGLTGPLNDCFAISPLIPPTDIPASENVTSPLAPYSAELFTSETGHNKDPEIFYFDKPFGLLYVNYNKHSDPIKVLECGQKVQFVAAAADASWVKVTHEKEVGFVRKANLVTQKVSKDDCLQSKYPEFFHLFSLSLADRIYLGRLYDHYIMGELGAK